MNKIKVYFYFFVLIFISLGASCNTGNDKQSIVKKIDSIPPKKEVKPKAYAISSDKTIQEIVYKGKKYVFIEANLKKQDVELFNEIDSTQKVHDFKSIHAVKEKENKQLLFAMNAGMFSKSQKPIGLYVSEGEISTPINLIQKGPGHRGNFYDFPPNGVFVINAKNKAFIIKSAEFGTFEKKNETLLATQSGPMLVIDGVFNKAFNDGSPNVNIRNGVGVNKKGNPVFVISKQEVNFYEFSVLFRDVLDCDNALYLDGVVSQWFAPEVNEKIESKYKIGPIVSVSNKKILKKKKDKKKKKEEDKKKGNDKKKDKGKKKPNQKEIKDTIVTKETSEGINKPKNKESIISKKVFLNKNYIVVEVDPKKLSVELFNKIDKNRVHNFNTIEKQKLENKEELIFAMNAGMFDENLMPIGLYVSEGKLIHPINLIKKGYGNFYSLPPNGVFAIDNKNKAYILSSDSFEKKTKSKKITLATQSGPMLVINGKFNKAFNQGSPNLNIRNGVGINRKGKIIFVISEDRVNFYEFSQFFRDELGCKNALYLDGFISQWYAPEFHDEVMKGTQLGPIISVSVKKKK